ncbi:unnamed protein product [Callosobruchus maculatus]|uniref:MADF domain-containing protein n=1 Tax=Callosobruchus maculatus TaxID=64391 RepID=A0A653BS32_CALMS|nr:unnamed protein product [Callosobruchus maculatus]
MSDLRYLTRDFLREFIELYRDHPCLWKTKSKEYLDKNKKKEAYNVLVEKLKSIQPDATKHTVIQKINSLRGGYRRERKKIKESLRSGNAAENVYVPTLWYYDLMDFVKYQEVPRESNVPSDEDHFESQEDDDLASFSETTNGVHVDDSVGANVSFHVKTNTAMSSPSTQIKSRDIRNRKKSLREPLTKEDEILNILGQKISTEEDDFSITGRYIASKLRRLPRETEIYTEKLINDILFKAELGQVDQYTIISRISPAHDNLGH